MNTGNFQTSLVAMFTDKSRTDPIREGEPRSVTIQVLFGNNRIAVWDSSPRVTASYYKVFDTFEKMSEAWQFNYKKDQVSAARIFGVDLDTLKIYQNESENAAKAIAEPKYIQLVNKITNDRKTGIDQFGLVSELNLFQEKSAWGSPESKRIWPKT